MKKKYFQTFLRDCKYVIPKLNPDYRAKNRDTQFLFIFENTSKIFSCPKKLFSFQLLSIIEMKKRNRMGPSLLEILTFHLLLFAMMWVKIIVGNLLFGEYSCNKITNFSHLWSFDKQCLCYFINTVISTILTYILIGPIQIYKYPQIVRTSNEYWINEILL